MTCRRCHHAMHQECARERGSRPIQLWACILCGDRSDDTIRFNRAMRLPETDFQRRERIMREIKLCVQQTVSA